MRNTFILLMVLLAGCRAQAQSYREDIEAYRRQYIKDLLAEPRHPVQPSQVKGISFFAADQKYCVDAVFTETPGSVPFLIPTHSGKFKPFREYGKLTFTIDGVPLQLHAYQAMDPVHGTAHADDLFVPFKDKTNYETTYGGGRYLDLLVGDIKDGKIKLDFNKCYNPYCAYANGFSCPVPPMENYLQVEIKAGEKDFVQ